MRWYIIRTLLLKEVLRHLADRGAIFLALLLVGASLIVSLFGKEEANSGGPQLVGGVKACYLDYEQDGPFIQHLIRSPPERTLNVRFRSFAEILRIGMVDERGVIVYEQNAGAIQVRQNGTDASGRPRYLIMLWHPGDPAALAPYTDWFWKETMRFFQNQGYPVAIQTAQEQVIYPGGAALIQVEPVPGPDPDKPLKKMIYGKNDDPSRVQTLFGDRAPVDIEVQTEELRNRSDMRSYLATALVVFSICFFSIYLMPCLTCEERERGVLLAQVLSPASAAEILAAKFLFYPTMGMALGIVLALIYSPPVLLRPFFWLSLLTVAVGYLGVGLTIASLARTQRMASMGAMCYMLTLALVLYISGAFNIPLINYLVFEYYGPRIIHASLVGMIEPYRWNLVGAMLLAGFWNWIAIRTFRQRGWQ